MRLICADYESYFDNDFTLSKLSTEHYIRDPRFEIHGIAVKWSASHQAKWYTREEWKFVSAQEDWSDVFMVHHHAQFDSLISSHHYDIHPAMLGCTLSMARLLLGNHISASLDSVRAQFGLQPKTTPYSIFRSKHWHELTLHEQQLVADGACDEVESIFKIFGMLLPNFPREELHAIDCTMKMFTEPRLKANSELLAQIWEKEDVDKRDRMDQLGVSASDLQ